MASEIQLHAVSQDSKTVQLYSISNNLMMKNIKCEQYIQRVCAKIATNYMKDTGHSLEQSFGILDPKVILASHNEYLLEFRLQLSTCSRIYQINRRVKVTNAETMKLVVDCFRK